MNNSVEIWMCTIKNPLNLVNSISALSQDFDENQIRTSLFSIRIIYNGVELNSSDLARIQLELNGLVNGLPVFINYSQPFSLSTARNFALNNSDADWGIFVDDDVEFQKGFVQSAIQATINASKNNCMLLGGRVELSGIPDNLEEVHKIYLSQLDYGSPSRVLTYEFVNGACFGVNRHKLLNMSLQFSEQLGRKGSLLLSGEESLLISQARLLGGDIWYENDLFVKHIVESERLTSSWLLKRMAWEAITNTIISANLGTSKGDSTYTHVQPNHQDILNMTKYKSFIESSLNGDTRILHAGNVGLGADQKESVNKLFLKFISIKIRRSKLFRLPFVRRYLRKVLHSSQNDL